MKKSAFPIRPHHALCISFFEGKGYSKEFVENMTNITNQLSENPLLTLKLTTEKDKICSACPNLIDGRCENHQQVLRYDLAVMDICGFYEGQEICAKNLFEAARNKIINVPAWGENSFQSDISNHKTNRLEEICVGCQWIDICLRQCNEMKG